MEIPALRNQILEFACHDENIRLVIETGAFARQNSPTPDKFSDLDIEFYARNPQFLLESQNWIESFGAVLICLALENEGFNPTRLVLYKSGAKVDFSLYDASLLQSGFRSQAQQRGFLVHLDKDFAAKNWSVLPLPKIEKPDAKVWLQLIDDFWFDTYNQAKYIWRGDLWTAKFLDAEIKQYLLKLLEWHGAARGADVWHIGHHLQNWTDETTFAETETLFARFDAADSRRALYATCDLFARLAREVSAMWDLQYPVETEQAVRILLARTEI